MVDIFGTTGKPLSESATGIPH